MLFEQDLVKRFKEMVGGFINVSWNNDERKEIDEIAEHLEQASIKLLEEGGPVGTLDLRKHNLGLLLEEIGELADSFSKGDEAEALDAVADSIYVLIGMAVAWNWPLAEVFASVHESNMTKAAGKDASANKGYFFADGYKSPEVSEILSVHRGDTPRQPLETATAMRQRQAKTQASNIASQIQENLIDAIDDDGTGES